ncbi:MAG: lamin tail domain-containing protein [Gemmatimonadota bacterium]|nr:lamin tail domain-containing protein [Gemmatimonadota bacterium]
MKQVLVVFLVFLVPDRTGLWAQAVVTPDTLRFGPVRAGSSVVDSVVVANGGQRDLVLTSASIEGNAFHLPDDLFADTGIVLPRDRAASLTVRFEPEDMAVYSGVLTVATSSGALKTPLAGEGVREVVVIQEILADPPAGVQGDANGDGTRHHSQDEFVELLNIGLKPVRLDGWQLSDAGTAPASRFTFPENTEMKPGQRLVLFGGGSPSGIPGLVFVDDGAIGGGLRNGGDSVFLIDPSAMDTVAAAQYEGKTGNQNQSIVRHPQGRGPFLLHSESPGDGVLFSPGRARKVTERPEVIPGDTPVDPGPTIRFGARVVIDEVLADPAPGPDGDANRDGVRDGKADEFVEIRNVDSEPVAIGGWWLSDDDVGSSGRFHFPVGMTLAPGMRAVLFGGGNPQDIPGHVFVDDGSIGNGLTNKGDRVLLVDPAADDTVAVADFQVTGNLNRSVVRFAEGVYVPHADLPNGGAISPGRPHPKPSAPAEAAKAPRPEFLDAPPSWCRVGALCRFTPSIRNLDGGFVHLETQVQGVRWDRASGEISWRPDQEGRFRFWQTAVSGSGEKTVRQFDVWVEPRPKIAIVEILADPPPGLNGDVNGDGSRGSQSDEFVEILNIGPDTVWISDWRLSDDDVSARRQFRFPGFTRLHPGERAVLFGGGRPEGIEGQVFVDDGSIGNGLTDRSDVILLIDSVLNDTLARAEYTAEGDIDQSLVWNGTVWVPHETPPGRGVFSPGLPSEKGTVVGKDAGSDDGEERDGYTPATIPVGVIISEILANPAPGAAGDTNADGVRHGFQDEFVELWNPRSDTARLEGCRLGDDDAPIGRLFEFPAGTLLPPGGFLVLFGGGSSSGFTESALVDDGRIGDGLSNSGDTVVFLSPGGADTLDIITYDAAPDGTSLVRREGAALQRHDLLPFTGLSSPGRAAPMLVAIQIVPDTLDIYSDSSHTVAADGFFDSETVTVVTEQLTWRVEDADVARLDPLPRLRGVAPGETVVHARHGRFTSSALVRVHSSIDGDGADSGDRNDGKTGGEYPPSNRPPVFISTPDTLAIRGLSYAYTPSAVDPDGHHVSISVPRRPAWLNWTETDLEGVPEHTGPWPVVITATDRSDTTVQSFTIDVVAPGLRQASRPDSVAYVGLTWRMSMDTSEGIQTQVDGGPVLDDTGESLVWRPRRGDEGPRVIRVSMSRNDVESLILTFLITVRPGPLVVVDEILADPTTDVSGDGTMDRHGDQFIELVNTAESAVDLSGWTLGDDDGRSFMFPEGSVLDGGERFVLFGRGTRGGARGCFSAGGLIGNGLDAEDRILLIVPAGPDTLVDVRYAKGRLGASLVPHPYMPGEWLAHSRVSNLPFSPGWATPIADSAFADSTGVSADNGNAYQERPFPNPFNVHTTIGFLSTGDPADLTVYNVLGQPVRRFSIAAVAGYHQQVWDGRDDLGRSVGTGIYLIRLRNGTRVRTMRVVLVK